MPTFREDTKIGGMVPMMKTDDINDQAITKDKIRDGNVTAEKLADGAVSTDKLPDGAIKTPKIADGNITTSKLAEASVVTSKIADQNVTKEKIADQSVDNSKLSHEAVTYDKLKDKAIITEKLNDRAVTTEKVEEKAITNAKIGDSAVDGRVISESSVEKKHLANDSVATEKLQDSSVTSDKIHTNAVTEEKIKDSAISNSKLADNSVSTSKIKDGNVTNEKVANNTITIDKFDPELRKSIQAATGLPENLVEVIQDVDVEVKSLHSKDEDLQSQIADKQHQITANDKDIESLQNRSTQMEQSINNIAVTGGASVANTVAYSNTASGLVSINAQGAIDELAAKNATKAEKEEVTAELEKKFDKESILQESGDAEDKVMSQKAVSDKLSDLGDTFAGVAAKNETPKDGKVFYIGYESGVYPNFDNVECYLNGLNILKRMPNGKFGNYFVGLDLPYAFQGNQAVNWGILDDYTFIHNNTSVTIKGKFNVIILFPYAKRTNLTKEFSIDVPKDSVSIVYAEVRNGYAEMFYCNIVRGSQETSFLKEIENKNGLTVVPLFIIEKGSEDIIPLLMMATGREDKVNLDSYYNKASYAQKSDILPIKALIKTTFDKNFYGRIDDFPGQPSIFPFEAHKNGGLVVRDSFANEDGFLHQIKACVTGNGVFSLRVGLLDQRNRFVERSRTNIVLSSGNNTINVLDKHILIKKGETVALSITNDSATCSQFYYRAEQSGEKTFLYSTSWDGVFSELATDFGGIVVFGFNMVSIESAFAYATDIEKTNETINTITSKLNKQQYVYDADNNPYKLRVIDGELVPLPINYKKVLALGNSLTSHAKKETIGYYGDESWAMASTNKVETTWTNYLERILKQKNVSASVTPFNISDWELNPNNVDLDSLFSKFSDTDYDLIIFRAGENGNYVDTYQEGFDRLIRFLQNKYKRSTIVVSEMFWHNSQKEAAFKNVADEHDLQYVNTGNINDRCLMGQMLMGIDNQFHPIVHNGVVGHCTDVCFYKYGNILANALGYKEIQNELHTVSVSTNKEYSINNTIQVYNGYVSILTYEDSVPTITGVDIQTISLASANWINKPDKVPTYASVFKMPNSDVNITIS